jgi:aminoglycoside phosphotransferase (APT) family kinase protein
LTAATPRSADVAGSPAGDLSPGQLQALARELEASGVVAEGAELRAELLAGGRSNLTYVISDGSSEWVLRSPPRRGAAPSAHDVAREYRILNHLAGTPVPVPKAFMLCESTDALGAPFMVMERVRGSIWRAETDVLGVPLSVRRDASESLVDTLAQMHLLPPPDAELGRGYLERQLRRWTEQWSRWKTQEVEEIEQLRARLSSRLPAHPRVGLVHGDFRFDNVVLDPDLGFRVKAVLDWELSTTGDPLADLGSLVAFWGGASVNPVLSHQEMTGLAGFLTVPEFVARYAAATGFTVDDLPVYVAFGCFRWAVIRQGIIFRTKLEGSAPVDLDLQWMARTVNDLAIRGLDILDGKEEL